MSNVKNSFKDWAARFPGAPTKSQHIYGQTLNCISSFSLEGNQLTIWPQRRGTPAPSSVCSWLLESEPETWRTSFLLLERSVIFPGSVCEHGEFSGGENNHVWSLQVRDVRIISDRNSRRSKGIAYIEFVDSSSVPLAIGLTGQRLLGVPIIVQASQVSLSTSCWPCVSGKNVVVHQFYDC